MIVKHHKDFSENPNLRCYDEKLNFYVKSQCNQNIIYLKQNKVLYIRIIVLCVLDRISYLFWYSFHFNAGIFQIVSR